MCLHRYMYMGARVYMCISNSVHSVLGMARIHTNTCSNANSACSTAKRTLGDDTVTTGRPLIGRNTTTAARVAVAVAAQRQQDQLGLRLLGFHSRGPVSGQNPEKLPLQHNISAINVSIIDFSIGNRNCYAILV